MSVRSVRFSDLQAFFSQWARSFTRRGLEVRDMWGLIGDVRGIHGVFICSGAEAMRCGGSIANMQRRAAHRYPASRRSGTRNASARSSVASSNPRSWLSENGSGPGTFANRTNSSHRSSRRSRRSKPLSLVVRRDSDVSRLARLLHAHRRASGTCHPRDRIPGLPHVKQAA